MPNSIGKSSKRLGKASLKTTVKTAAISPKTTLKIYKSIAKSTKRLGKTT